MKNDLLLLSNSVLFGRPFLAHALEAIAELLASRKTLYFVPYALRDLDGYTAVVQTALQPLGIQVIGLHTTPEPRTALEQAEAVFVGGGNSFRLSKMIHTQGLIEPVRRRVAAGDLIYLGSSAGTNQACPTLRTTNDMPIVQPPSFEALNLIPIQINPHYVDPDPGSTHMGETRAKRIHEFLEENDVPVLGMREGAWLRRRDQQLVLQGSTGARLFRRGMAEVEYAPGSDLSFLLAPSYRFDAR